MIQRQRSNAWSSGSLFILSECYISITIFLGLAGKEHLGLEASSQLKASSINGERGEGKAIDGVDEDDEFDPSAPPPFRLAEVRAVIPKHCWVKDPWKSMSYVFRDFIVIFGLAIAAIYLDRWVVWPLYWAAQGTMFWALFVLGHDW